MGKKLNEVTKVTTMNENDYAVLNTADGKTVQIKKSDLANALVEVMPAIKASYVERGYTVTDLNLEHQDKDPGLYISLVAKHTLNRPAGVSTGNLIMSIRHSKNDVSSSQIIMQILHSGYVIKCRIGTGNGEDIIWKEWGTIYE